MYEREKKSKRDPVVLFLITKKVNRIIIKKKNEVCEMRDCVESII